MATRPCFWDGQLRKNPKPAKCPTNVSKSGFVRVLDVAFCILVKQQGRKSGVASNNLTLVFVVLTQGASVVWQRT